jgi:hypothetical protein
MFCYKALSRALDFSVSHGFKANNSRNLRGWMVIFYCSFQMYSGWLASNLNSIIRCSRPNLVCYKRKAFDAFPPVYVKIELTGDGIAS